MASNSQSDRFLVGLEIHQQLECRTKLFCACPPLKSEDLPYSFERRLRPAQSETGRVDPAALFEYSKGKSNRYLWSPESSCLVEADEEPPHPLSGDGLEGALLTALTLGSKVLDEVHVMRKIVIDGSNTSGFQRTAVVGLGGSMMVGGTRVGVQTVTLEEDAARIMGDADGARVFALDRLGVALVEVALEPIAGDPELVTAAAQHLGRILRSTGRVARGLGTIRQDLNVSMNGGAVVEIKGVQKLNLLPKVVDYERRRQKGLALVAERARTRGVSKVECRVEDATSSLGASSSRVLRNAAGEGGKVAMVVAVGLGGLVGWEPTPGIRLGKELAEVARANSLGGVIHSDEFEKQGISEAEAAKLRKEYSVGPEDAMVLVAGKGAIVDACVPRILERLEVVSAGVPAETRAATELGETRYMRPRPGSQRMYPETDIPNVRVDEKGLRTLASRVPENWESRVSGLSASYGISRDLSLKLYDSEIDGSFEELVKGLRVEPSVIASTLVDVPVRLAREGVPEEAITLDAMSSVLQAVSDGRAAKEAIPDILKAAATHASSVEDAIRSLGLTASSEAEIGSVVKSLVESRRDLIRDRGEAAFAPLMGEAMKELRGRADGATVARILRKAIEVSLK